MPTGIQRPPNSTSIVSDLLLGSGMTDGKWIGISATSGPGTLLHQGGATGGMIDAVTLCACNNDTVVRTVTVTWGGGTATLVQQLQPQTGFRLLLDRFRLGRTMTLYMYASVADVVTAYVEISKVVA